MGLPVFVGQEPLIPRALAAGAIGSVSGLAAAFPEVVREALDRPDPGAAERLAALRSTLEGAGPFIAAVKHALGARGVPVGPDLRPPMRRLSAEEAERLDGALSSSPALAGA